MTLREIKSEITGSLWKVLKAPGDRVAEDDPLMILESMKMEIPVIADASGILKELLVAEGESVSEGQVVARIET
ncbi:biotin/lipoyl-binding carrier protein [Variovorax sp. PBL-E5]|uniref:biotin/lipoyl-binding carrier protein n=1 Tax=Variovorax sp. PBL-E5 TaxID=434014 RepID=UPI001316479F|nr:biotin/lipoyl-binding carrier protein [Variovorax sp. PBL-E5]VTU38370.1 Biotin/lipoyl attachment protein [Variovorax sp. PBL-E5]